MGSRRFHINLKPDIHSEHRSDLISWADGRVVSLVRELRPHLWQTDLKVPHPGGDNDYEHDGFLVVMPETDGHFTYSDVPPRK